MDRRTYGPKLAALNLAASGYRLTFRKGRGNILACELWQERLGSRGFYHEMEQVDRWYADDPLVVVRSLDDIRLTAIEACMQQRLPGID